jgi:Na+-driven multidrug efflux pump
MATSTIVCAAVTLLLIRQFGIAAGAIGTSTSYCAALAICIYMFCRRTGVHPGELVAFKAADLQQYRSLARWIFSGVHAKYATYVRRGG